MFSRVPTQTEGALAARPESCAAVVEARGGGASLMPTNEEYRDRVVAMHASVRSAMRAAFAAREIEMGVTDACPTCGDQARLRKVPWVVSNPAGEPPCCDACFALELAGRYHEMQQILGVP